MTPFAALVVIMGVLSPVLALLVLATLALNGLAWLVDRRRRDQARREGGRP